MSERASLSDFTRLRLCRPVKRQRSVRRGCVFDRSLHGAMLLCVATACSVNPVSLRPRLLALGTDSQISFGNQAADEMARQVGVVDKEDLTRYLQQLGTRLASVAPGQTFSYRFEILDVGAPNAIGFPGGRVQITRGLLALLENEAELAGVLAHEIAHVALNHTSERLTITLPLDLVTSVLAAPVSLFDEPTAHRLRDALPQYLMAPYSRAQEREADRAAAAILASLGVSPMSLAAALTAVAAEPVPEAGALRPEGDATHPSTAERIETLAIYDRLMTRGPAWTEIATREEWLHLLDGLLVGPSPAAGALIDDATYVIPELGLVLELPRGWSVQMQARELVAVDPESLLSIVVGHSPPGSVREEIVPEAGVIRLTTLTSPTGVAVERFVVVPPDQPTARLRFWWLDFGGSRVQITSTSGLQTDAVAPQLGDRIALSARPSRREDLARIGVWRLRLVCAEAGETLAELVERGGATPTVFDVARGNRCELDTTLAVGQLVKIARAEWLGDTRPRDPHRP